jgi:hypothetical protein
MRKRVKFSSAKFVSEEAGQALILILVFFLLGSLTIVPTLAHMSTALKSGVSYENKTNEFYAADAGIEDGIWRIKYDSMGPDYDVYDYSTAWPYETDTVNDRTADVTIQNVPIPEELRSLTPTQARTIIESEKLVVTGTSGAIPGAPYHIKIEFTPATGDNLTVKSVGIWLPQGFTYEGPSNLEEDFSDEYYPDSVDVTTVPGGQTVVWSYNSPPLFTSFPDVDPEALTMTTDITFDYTPPEENPSEMPVAIAWITTDMDPSCPNPNDVPISWDTDTRIYKITSATGDTRIEAYSSKCQLRKLGDAIAGDYVAIGNSLLADDDGDHIRDDWHTPSDYTLTTVPADGDVIAAYLYWSGWRRETAKVNALSETCSNFDNWDRNSEDGSQTRVPTADGDTSGTWDTSPRWDDIDETTPNDTDYMTGTTDGGGYQLFSFSPFSIPAGAAITDLTVYIRAKDVSNGNNDIRPSITVNGTRYNTTAPGNNPGNGWTTYSYSYTTNPNTLSAWTAADINGTGPHPLQQFGVYSDDLKPDVQVSMVYALVNYTSDSLWTISSGKFQGRGAGSATTAQRTLTLNSSLNLSSFTPGTVCVTWEQTETGTLEEEDTLYFALSDDGGDNWSSDIEAFHDDSPSSYFWYHIPDAYLTGNFMIRFYFNFNDPAEYVNLDNIKVSYMVPDTSITFKINDQQVYLDASGEPQAGASPLTSERSNVMPNNMLGTSEGYSYASMRDVSKLVKKYPVVPGEEHHTGNTKYTVDAVSADTYAGANFAFAGWSLIIIYGSPETAGHYLYLRDDNFAFHPGTGGSLDFDDDGEPGGDITNFVVPEPIKDKYGVVTETVAAKLTCFVVEGDLWRTGDSVEITGQQSGQSKFLSNTQSPMDNVWNGLWPHEAGTTVYEGVDIDTFEVLWADNILMPKDTLLTVDLESPQDSWNLVYLILSVRSETTISGTVHYLISNN